VTFLKTNADPNLLLDLGLQPISNRFLPLDSNDSVPHYPMRLMLQKDTGCIHLEKPFPVEALKPHYDWLTCFEPEDHLDGLVEKLTNLPGISQESVFGSYSFKDDSTLNRLRNHGCLNQWRIDPEEDLGIVDIFASVETYQAEFTVSKALQIRQRHGAADVMIVRHVIEHAYNLTTFLEAIRTLIKTDGYIVWELPDCERALAEGDCTTIWEEHVLYFTSFTFRQLLQDSGFSIIHYESVPYPLEDSIVAIVQITQSETDVAQRDPVSVDREVKRARGFAEAIVRRRDIIRSKLESFRKENGCIALFGAGHLSVAFISIMGVEDLIEFVIDDNSHKNGMRMPVGRLEILCSDALYYRDVSLCLLGLNPHNQPNVIDKHYQFIERGGIFASIFPGSNLDLEEML